MKGAVENRGRIFFFFFFWLEGRGEGGSWESHRRFAWVFNCYFSFFYVLGSALHHTSIINIGFGHSNPRELMIRNRVFFSVSLKSLLKFDSTVYFFWGGLGARAEKGWYLEPKMETRLVAAIFFFAFAFVPYSHPVPELEFWSTASRRLKKTYFLV